MIITTGIHGPIHHRLIHDEEEHRTWCVANYENDSRLEYYDSIMIILHFILPLSINFISILMIIILKARNQAILHKKKMFKQMKEQLHQYSYMIVSSCILVILALPRLIISLRGGCMKSARDPWLSLSGYFVSFIPSALFFFVFVLSSPLYRKEFTQAIKRLR